MPYPNQNARSFSPSVRFFAADLSPGDLAHRASATSSSSPLAPWRLADKAVAVSLPDALFAASPDAPVLDRRIIDNLQTLVSATSRLDDGLLGTLLGLFRRDAPQYASTARAAWAAGDMTNAKESAHALKGSAGSIGAKRAAAVAEVMLYALRGAAAFDAALADRLVDEVAIAEAALLAEFAGAASSPPPAPSPETSR
jgi:HPt (histidine-containing phosphotransfer) domain-containing protein